MVSSLPIPPPQLAALTTERPPWQRTCHQGEHKIIIQYVITTALLTTSPAPADVVVLMSIGSHKPVTTHFQTRHFTNASFTPVESTPLHPLHLTLHDALPGSGRPCLTGVAIHFPNERCTSLNIVPIGKQSTAVSGRETAIYSSRPNPFSSPRNLVHVTINLARFSSLVGMGATVSLMHQDVCEKLGKAKIPFEIPYFPRSRKQPDACHGMLHCSCRPTRPLPHC